MLNFFRRVADHRHRPDPYVDYARLFHHVLNQPLKGSELFWNVMFEGVASVSLGRDTAFYVEQTMLRYFSEKIVENEYGKPLMTVSDFLRSASEIQKQAIQMLSDVKGDDPAVKDGIQKLMKGSVKILKRGGPNLSNYLRVSHSPAGAFDHP